jgi:hypothetical protein
MAPHLRLQLQEGILDAKATGSQGEHLRKSSGGLRDFQALDSDTGIGRDRRWTKKEAGSRATIEHRADPLIRRLHPVSLPRILGT